LLCIYLIEQGEPNQPRRSLQRMLSRSGKLTMRNLAAIFQTPREALHVDLQAKSMRPTS
jgi:hypothetical protein